MPHQNIPACTAADLLKQGSLRFTPTRELILNLLSKSERPLSHADIGLALAAKDLDRVTIYRTLASFQKAGLAHRVQGLDGTWRFRLHTQESDSCQGNHPHFLCQSCGEMSCLIGQSIQRVQIPEGSIVEGKQLVVYGRCAACAQEHEESEGAIQ